MLRATPFERSVAFTLVKLAMLGALGCGGRIDAATNQGRSVAPIAQHDLLSNLEKAICDAGVDCCRKATSPHGNDCRATVRRIWQKRLDHAAQIGANYDPIQAGLCVQETELEWKNCADTKTYTSLSELTCDRVFTASSPDRLPGEICAFTMDCVNSAEAPTRCMEVLGPNGSEKICRLVVLSEEDGTCGDAIGNYFATCRAPFVCGRDRRCHSRPERDESCSNFDSDACSPGNVCDREASLSCRTALPVGDGCAEERSYCEHSNCVNGRCAVLPDLWIDVYCP